MNLVRFANPDELARGAAERVREARRKTLAEGESFTLVLSGGESPRRLYRELAKDDWSHTRFLFSDERCVPPDHERSNYRMVRETLLDAGGIKESEVYRMEGERPPAEAARRYEALLRGLFVRSEPRLDLVLLGIGKDGHTASLFPDTKALEERSLWIAANHVPALDEWRLTFTLPGLAIARQVVFLVSGRDKALVVAEAFGGATHGTPHPCELVAPQAGEVWVLCDAEAASAVPG